MPANEYVIVPGSDAERFMRETLAPWRDACERLSEALFAIAQETNMPPPILLARLAQMQGAAIASFIAPQDREFARQHCAEVPKFTEDGIYSMLHH